jgi:hypothetical protein
MGDEQKRKHANQDCEPDCDCGPDCDCEEQEIEIVELEDENGDVEEYAILDELDFEKRHFVIMAPLSEVQALHDSEFEEGEDTGNEEEDDDDDDDDFGLSIELFEVKDDNFSIVEDEKLALRLMEHLEKIAGS